MASSSYEKMGVDQFNGSNFELWKLKMEDMLKDRDLWEVASLPMRPAAMSQADWDLKDQKAKGLIRLYLANFFLLDICSACP